MLIKLYFIFILMTTIFTYFNIYYGAYWNKNTFYIAYLFLIFLIIIKSKFSKSLLEKLVIYFIPLIFIRQHIATYLIACLGIKINLKCRIKIVLLINSIFYFMTIFLYKLGYLVPNEKISTRQIDGKTIIRESLGFNNPNQTFIFFMLIITGLIYLYYRKNQILIIAIVFLLSTYIYIQTNSRTSYYTVILILFFLKIPNRIIKILKKYTILFICFFPTITYLISGPLYNDKLNKFLSFRPYIYRQVFLGKIGKITLFGNLDKSGYPLDNAFINVFYRNGIIGIIIFILVLNFILRILLKNKDYLGVKIFLGTLFFGLLEKDIIYYYFTIIIYILPTYLNKEKIKIGT